MLSDCIWFWISGSIGVKCSIGLTASHRFPSITGQACAPSLASHSIWQVGMTSTGQSEGGHCDNLNKCHSVCLSIFSVQSIADSVFSCQVAWMMLLVFNQTVLKFVVCCCSVAVCCMPKLHKTYVMCFGPLLFVAVCFGGLWLWYGMAGLCCELQHDGSCWTDWAHSDSG